VRVAWSVGALEVRRRLLDRSAVLTSFVAPFVLAAILGAAFGGHGGAPVRIGIAVASPSPQVQATVREALATVAGGARLRLVPVADERALRRRVAVGQLSAGVVVPPTVVLGDPGLGRNAPTAASTTAGWGSVRSWAAGAVAQAEAITPPGGRRDVVTLVVPRGDAVASEAARAVAAAVAARAYSGALVATVAHGPPGAGAGLEAWRQAAVRAAAAVPPLPLAVDDVGAGNVLGYLAPSMAVVFLYIGAGLGTRAIVIERTEGTLARLAVAPVRSGAVVAGKMLALLAVSLASVLALWGETTWLFGASWGAPGAVAAMCVAVTLAMVALATFLTSLARDERQAFTASVLVGFVLALVGGNFFPPAALPRLLEDLGLATPNGWALVGFGRLSLEHLGLGAVGVPLAVLAGITVVFGVAALARIGRVVEL